MLRPVRLGLFTAPSPFVPSLHRLKTTIFKIFIPLASFSYATWSSATFLASCSEPWTCGNFNTLREFLLHYTLHDLDYFTGPSSIVPSLHRLKVCIFILFTPLALISYATLSSTIFLASYSEAWNCMVSFHYPESFYYITPCMIWIFHTSVYRLYLYCTGRMACIFKLFTPLASSSYATWSSATFLASWQWAYEFAEISITPMLSTTLKPVGLGLFTASVYQLYLHCTDWMASFFKLFKPLASFSYATWSSAIFLASWSEPRICWNFNTPIAFYYVTSL